MLTAFMYSIKKIETAEKYIKSLICVLTWSVIDQYT